MDLGNPDDLLVRFDELTGRGVRVAIVDTGIDPTHPSVGQVSHGRGLSLSTEGAVTEDPDSLDGFGHGTACAAIVRQIAPQCELIAVRISTAQDPIPPRLLVAGIDTALELGADVINVSAGTSGTSQASALAGACARAAEARVAVLASESNEGDPTYPAAFDSVLVVGGEGTERTRHAYGCDASQARRLVAYGGYQRVAWVEPRFLFLQGSSFAAARVSGIVALLVQRFGRLSQESLIRILRHNSTNGSRAAWVSTTGRELPISDPGSIEWIHRAALYPYSKEVHSLVRFRHLLPFEIVGIADPAMKGCVGKDAGEIIGGPPAGLTVTASLDEALHGADTLILGFTSELERLQRRNRAAELAGRAIKMGKNVYSLEPLDTPQNGNLLFEAARSGVRIGWPAVDTSELEDLRQEMSQSSSYSEIPILGVFGTSRSQGKFTLQLLLREHLLARGLRVGQIGTEHQSRLFGMDDCFPVGYRGTISLKYAEWPEYFDLRLRRIARERRPDIIIVGSQGGVVPHGAPSPKNVMGAMLGLYVAMMIRADSYLLVVNHLDDPRFIQDSLDVLRIIGKGKTILLAVSSRRKRIVRSFGRTLIAAEYSDPARQSEYVQWLEREFRLPAVTILDEEGQRRLLDVVLERYSTG